MRRKWEAELLPECLAMGIGYDEFWMLNPRKLKAMINGYKLKRKIQDEQAWMLGGYVFEAVSIAVGNATRKKGQKARNYFEEQAKPFLNDIDKDELSDDAKKRGIAAVMAQLHVMQNNFELKHGE